MNPTLFAELLADKAQLGGDVKTTVAMLLYVRLRWLKDIDAMRCVKRECRKAIKEWCE